MAIFYNGTTFSGSNSQQNVVYNGTTLCNVVGYECNSILGFSVPTVEYTRGTWQRVGDWGDDDIHACVHHIDPDGKVWVCWWTYPDACHWLIHDCFHLDSDLCLSMCYRSYVHAYDTGTSSGRPRIIVHGTGGECSHCSFVCELSSSQWNPTCIWYSCLIAASCPNSTATCSFLGSFECCYSDKFSFYFPDRSVGVFWYLGRGTYAARGEGCSEYCVDNICFGDYLSNGVLCNCFIGNGKATICA